MPLESVYKQDGKDMSKFKPKLFLHIHIHRLDPSNMFEARARALVGICASRAENFMA